MRKRVVLLGKGEQAIRIATWFARSREYDLVHIVPVVPEPSWTDSLIEWCDEHSVPCVASGDYRDIPGVDADTWRVDLAISVFCSAILPVWFIDRTARCINLHNAPLPRYRGVAPINWALKNKETVHGVTIHEITPRLDAGPIVAQVLFDIDPRVDEVIDVYRRALDYGYALFERTMPILDQIEPVPQEEALASYYSLQDRRLLDDRSDFTRAKSRATPACT